MPRYSLHAVGRDRPGMVAAVAAALADIGCNLEDSRMTILAGQFSIMLVLDAPGELSAAGVEQALSSVAARLDLLVAVREVDETATSSADGELVVVSVHGADHPGIVARIAGEVAAAGGNVVDLATRVVGASGDHTYVMVLTVELEPVADAASFARRLEAAATDAGVHCVVSPADAELL